MKIVARELTDEECLKQFIKMLETRVSITTGFAKTDEDGPMTHQFLKVTCGPHEVVSTPEELNIPLQVATAKDVGATVQ